MRFAAAAKSYEQTRAESRRWYQQAVGSVPPPEYRNVEAVQRLDAPLRFDYRGVPFVAQPTSHRDGVWLVSWQSRLADVAAREKAAAADVTGDVGLTPEQRAGVDGRLAEMATLYAEAAERFGRMARPARWLDRLRCRKRNPFADATEGEISYLVGFFWTCRTIARVRRAPTN